MAQLAIKGHATRGNEVIELLKMLGGVNSANFSGKETDRGYYIEVDKSICFIDNDVEYMAEFRNLTLEQFLEKYPYLEYSRRLGTRLEQHFRQALYICCRWGDMAKRVSNKTMYSRFPNSRNARYFL